MKNRIKIFIFTGLFLTIFFGAVVIAVSNTGFKIWYPLVHQGELPVNDFQVSFPFWGPYEVANDIFQEVENAIYVMRFNPPSNTVTVWFPGFVGNNFPIEPGTGYIIRIPENTSTGIMLVGSHNPSFFYDFNLTNKDFLISIPYHTTWETANDIYQDIPHATQISKLNPATNTITVWFPGFTGNNFSVVVGEAYRIRVSDTPSQLVPPHF